MADRITFNGIPFVFDEQVPTGVMLVFDDHGGFEIFSVVLDPPPAEPGKQEQGEST